MEFVTTTIYVDDVEEVLDFYFQAFGLNTRLLDENAAYGELDTGAVKIAFATHPYAQSRFKQGYIRSQPKQPPLGFELSLACDNLSASYDKAVAAGAEPLSPPHLCDGGEKRAYVRAIEGTLVALCAR